MESTDATKSLQPGPPSPGSAGWVHVEDGGPQLPGGVVDQGAATEGDDEDRSELKLPGQGTDNIEELKLRNAYLEQLVAARSALDGKGVYIDPMPHAWGVMRDRTAARASMT